MSTPITPVPTIRAALVALALTVSMAACAPAPGPGPGPAPTTPSSAATPSPRTASFSLALADGTVTVAGAAPADEAKRHAVAAVAEGLGAGVPVTDRLSVAPGSWLPTPDRLAALASALVTVDAVSLNVNAGEAVLGGTVASEQEKSDAAGAVATAFPEVTLANNLAVVPVCDVRGAKVRELSKPPALVFATGSAELDDAARASVAKIAALVAQCPGTELTVVGQTDARGAEPGNEDLARRRARAVADALVAAGVPADAVLVQGNAANAPVSDDNALNRRVDVAVR